MMLQNLSITFAPLLPWLAVAGFAAVAVALLALGWLRRARGMAWRSLVLAVLLLTLANPAAVLEDRAPLDDVGLVIVDESPSQGIGQRHAQTEAALAALETQAKKLKHFELRVVRTTGQDASDRDSGTELFKALDDALSEIPRQRFAGAVMITDGEVHDVPSAQTAAALGAPLHALLTGARNEHDRRLKVVDAPSYGLVGKPLNLTVRVDDLPGPSQGEATLTLRRDGGDETTMPIPLGQDVKIPMTLDHPGQTVFELSVDPGPHPLTLLNKRAVVAVNGVRDRLRVLLVSGEPNPGERTWRNLLKSDPSVDLVHFTILRPPEKLDATPVRELSLITFPVHELFDVKLHEFDLIIFDRYRRRGELSNVYLQNIADYVNKGGAMLVAVGPSFSSPVSFYYTPLAEVMPASPTGQILVQGFRPKVTALGERHPVTADLPGENSESGGEPSWGRWFRQVDVSPKGGDTLMTGIDNRPLLQLEHVGKGRVALLASDQMWLWSRGYEGGGPSSELLRRIAHWLMKEPELEEESLRAEVAGKTIKVVRQSLDPKPVTVEVTTPSGRKLGLPLKPDHGGLSSATLTADELGLYRVSDGKHTALAAVGPLNPKEFADVRATDARLAPAVAATGGGIHWLADGGVPELRQASARHSYAGAGLGGAWLAFKSNGDYVVTGVRQAPLLPGLLVLLAALGALAFAWRREGR
ncbi:MAG TPA: hypothetical protein VKY65_22055 [Alphaproteobacteria bacterium]|nr:hypothetical protein [Alphaproteobacteria bacterium]